MSTQCRVVWVDCIWFTLIAPGIRLHTSLNTKKSSSHSEWGDRCARKFVLNINYTVMHSCAAALTLCAPWCNLSHMKNHLRKLPSYKLESCYLLEGVAVVEAHHGMLFKSALHMHSSSPKFSFEVDLQEPNHRHPVPSILPVVECKNRGLENSF